MHKAVLLTGSNQGDRWAQLSQCNQLLELYVGPILNASSIYETGSWGKEDLPAHLNQALYVATDLTPLHLLAVLQKIEAALGRIRQEKWGLRTIDIDIIYYDNDAFNLPNLVIPHPLMQQRRFVLTPINQILPNYVHPVFQKTNTTLLAECADPLPVTLAH